jgi:hypothetical protein
MIGERPQAGPAALCHEPASSSRDDRGVVEESIHKVNECMSVEDIDLRLSGTDVRGRPTIVGHRPH